MNLILGVLFSEYYREIEIYNDAGNFVKTRRINTFPHSSFLEEVFQNYKYEDFNNERVYNLMFRKLFTDNLKALYISVSKLYYGNLFEEEFSVPSLNRLVVNWNSAEDIPDSFYRFPNLTYLRVRGDLESEIKPSIYFEKSFTELAYLREIDLFSLDIKKNPTSILEKLQEKRARILLNHCLPKRL